MRCNLLFFCLIIIRATLVDAGTTNPALRVTMSPALFGKASGNIFSGVELGMTGNTSKMNPISNGWWKSFFDNNVTIESFKLPANIQKSTANDGSITSTAANVNIELSVSGNFGSWWRGTGPNGEHSGTISTSTASLKSVLSPTSVNGIAAFKASEASIDLGILSSTGLNRSWSSSLLKYPDFQTELLSVVKKQFANFSAQIAQGDLAFKEFPISISFKPVAEPVITSNYISIGYDGTVYLTSQGYVKPDIENNVTLPTHDFNESLQIYGTEYMAQSALSKLYKKGSMSFTLFPEDIADCSPFFLNTTSLGLLIPQLPQIYPNANPVRLSFVANPNIAPEVHFNENVALDYHFECSFDVLKNGTSGEYENACVITGSVKSVGSVAVANSNEVKATLSSLNFSNFTVKSSNIGNINAFLLVFKLNLASGGLVCPINNGVLAKPLLSLSNITIAGLNIGTGADLTVEVGYFSLISNAVVAE